MSKETEKGRVYPVHEITGEGPETIHGGQFTGHQDCDKTDNSSCSNGNLAVPGHQQHCFEESCKDLTEEQGDNVARLLIKYEEVFRNTTFTGKKPNRRSSE